MQRCSRPVMLSSSGGKEEWGGVVGVGGMYVSTDNVIRDKGVGDRTSKDEEVMGGGGVLSDGNGGEVCEGMCGKGGGGGMKGPCVWMWCDDMTEARDMLEGEWTLDFNKSDSLSPLMEATGVSWLVRNAVKMSGTYTNSIRVVGSRVVIKTAIQAGEDSQTTHIHGNLHNTKELDGDLYTTLTGWDSKEGRLISLRHHEEKGLIRQTRQITKTEPGIVEQRSHIQLIPTGSVDPSIDLSLYFTRACEVVSPISSSS
eukprot:GHVQ01002027.1.p1 GENE.GHVQ01002027.1~~GHVQ01002027.1.p1  ORF type:complete len:256 (-),score=66.95 GHVQ01002027.1:576-1343(-)